MTSDSRRNRDTLPLEAHERIDRTCATFEAAWKSGTRPMIEEFLGSAGGAERSALLRELLMLELEYRRKSGESPSPDDYAKRFPNDRALIDSVFAKSDKRRAASSEAAPAPAARPLPETASLPPGAPTGSLVSTQVEPREQARRIRCPHCGNRIQLVRRSGSRCRCKEFESKRSKMVRSNGPRSTK